MDLDRLSGVLDTGDVTAVDGRQCNQHCIHTDHQRHHRQERQVDRDQNSDVQTDDADKDLCVVLVVDRAAGLGSLDTEAGHIRRPLGVADEQAIDHAVGVIECLRNPQRQH